MKIAELNEEVARQEHYDAEQKAAEKSAYEQAMEDFRKSPAHAYVMEHFKQAEDKIIGKIEEMQVKGMKDIFMKSEKEQLELLTEMSKRSAILEGALAIVATVKNKL